MRKLLGTIAGIAVAIAIMLAIEWLDGQLYPLPTDIDYDDPVAIAAIIPGMPLPAKLIVVSAWLLAAFGGAWMALRITDWRWSGVVVMLFVIAGGVINFLQLPHPVWMRVCAVVLPIIGGWLAVRLHHKPYPGEPLLG
jgi:hypothetical protein